MNRRQLLLATIGAAALPAAVAAAAPPKYVTVTLNGISAEETRARLLEAFESACARSGMSKVGTRWYLPESWFPGEHT